MEDYKEKIAKLEERLANAAATFKEMKSQLDLKNKENEELKNRITELEGEIALDGGAKEEVDGLKARLEKAKEVFASQKEKIAELTEYNANVTGELENVKEAKEALQADNEDLVKKVKTLEEDAAIMNDKLNAIAEIINK